jgi:hypothetical protein
VRAEEFVVALLSDLFGIQARGGCSCAGPYGHRLLGIDAAQARDFAGQAVDGWLGIKPGWTRLSFSFYLSEPEFDYVVAAVHLVASHGHRLLGDYLFDPRSGLWTHRDAPPPPSLEQLLSGSPQEPRQGVPDSELAGYLRQAQAILTEPRQAPAPSGVLADPLERLRWFELPGERLATTPAARWLRRRGRL